MLSERAARVITRIEDEERALAKRGERTHWIIERAAIEWICAEIAARKPARIVECGTSVGYSTIWLAEAAGAYGGAVISIERDPEKSKIARENIEEVGCRNVELIEGDATEILKKWPAHIDFLFLDANKKGYLPQFLAAKPHLSGDAFVIADNIIDMKERLEEFVQYMLQEEQEFTSEIKEIADGLLVAKRK